MLSLGEEATASGHPGYFSAADDSFTDWRDMVI
jgi:hypothetical protein